MSLFIDEFPIILILISTSEFQLDSFGKIQKGIINLVHIIFIDTLLASLLVIITFLLSQTNVYAKKLSPFECGVDPRDLACLFISINFFNSYYISAI